MNKIKNERIESIDALRAFALLGILLVHTSQLFNFNNENNVFPFFSEFGNHQIDFITQFFQNRFLTLFSILFGISFFLILRNPNYSQTKFCWRCILLMVFGLFNKFVYTTDVLVWYGINGIILSMLPVRRFSAKSILVLSFVTFIISFQDFINFGHFFWPEYAYSKRYLISTGITGILTFPYFEILKEDAHLFFGLGSLTLSYFLFGYYLGKSGLIERIDKVVNTKLILSSTLIFISVSCFYYSIGAPQNIKKISDLISALYYAIMYIYIYNRSHHLLSFMKYFGKLGLTNYSIQNLILPLIIALVLRYTECSFEHILCISLLFYGLQTLFSIIWLKNHKYGPLEHLWRICTNLKFTSNKR